MFGPTPGALLSRAPHRTYRIDRDGLVCSRRSIVWVEAAPESSHAGACFQRYLRRPIACHLTWTPSLQLDRVRRAAKSSASYTSS